jgi:hypothetical protein
MSYSYEAAGYFLEQRGEQGQFVEGEILPVMLPVDAAERIESMNRGAAEACRAVYYAARDLILARHFGDFEEGRFKVLINGHVQNPDDPNSSKSYAQVRIEAL